MDRISGSVLVAYVIGFAVGVLPNYGFALNILIGATAGFALVLGPMSWLKKGSGSNVS